MYGFFLIVMILVFSAASADARHYRHRHHGVPTYAYVHRNNDAIVRPGPYQNEGSRSEVTPPPAASDAIKESVIPPDWKKQPLDHPALDGARFVSPDGLASFDFYTTAAHDEPIADHMKGFAFGDKDEITSLAGERTWIAASGFKDDRLFYRKAALACGGDRWHHIAFDYPINAKRNMRDFVRRAVDELNGGQNAGCDTPLSQRANDGDAHSAKESPSGCS